MKSKTTQTARIRKALKANPDKTPKQIADSLGINPRAVHMVKYLDKKRATQKADVANKTPKLVVEKKAPVGWTSTATPSHSPAWVKRNLSNEMDAVKQTIAEIKAREPERGTNLSRMEIVVIAVIVFCLIQVGITLVQRGM